MEKIKINLTKPILVNGELTDELEIKSTDINVGALIKMNKQIPERHPFDTTSFIWRDPSQMETMRSMLMHIFNLNEVEVNQISGKDLKNINTAVEPFLDSQDETTKSE